MARAASDDRVEADPCSKPAQEKTCSLNIKPWAPGVKKKIPRRDRRMPGSGTAPPEREVIAARFPAIAALLGEAADENEPAFADGGLGQPGGWRGQGVRERVERAPVVFDLERHPF